MKFGNVNNVPQERRQTREITSITALLLPSSGFYLNNLAQDTHTRACVLKSSPKVACFVNEALRRSVSPCIPKPSTSEDSAGYRRDLAATVSEAQGQRRKNSNGDTWQPRGTPLSLPLMITC